MEEPVRRAGSVLAGRYRLVRPIGSGAFAAVWEAEHVTLHSRLAIKFLHRTGPRAGDASQRFLREARVAASVKHRNVLDIRDFGFTEEEDEGTAVPYMAMELLRGRTLGALLAAEKRLPVERAARILGDALRGLAAVHDAGLVHRDLKPENVFLVEDEDGAFPKLLDFGLSRRSGRGEITADGALLGTPLYMSPEQARGEANLDARTDIYSMGVVMFEMLAGTTPFAGGSVLETITRVRHEKPPPLRSLAPWVPEAVAHVVHEAMQSEREQRFVDARAMRSALLAAVSPAGIDRGSAPTLLALPALPERESVSEILRQSARDDGRRTVEDPPEEEAAEKDDATRPRENRLVVLVRTLALAAVAIGVAVLVLDLPSLVGPSTPTADPGHGDAGGDAPATIVEATPDAGERDATSLLDAPDASDAAIDDAAIDDAALDDAALDDAGTDAAADDAGTDAAIDVADAALDDHGGTPDPIDAAVSRTHPRRRVGRPPTHRPSTRRPRRHVPARRHRRPR